MDGYNKVKIQKCINNENGTNYHRNIPLDGYTITLGDAFISFSFKEVNGINTVIIHYLFVTKKDDLITLLAYCTNIWSGNCVKMIYYSEHHRKSNIIKTFKHLGFEVVDYEKDSWKYDWESTNGYAENDCIEAFVINKQLKK